MSLVAVFHPPKPTVLSRIASPFIFVYSFFRFIYMYLNTEIHRVDVKDNEDMLIDTRLIEVRKVDFGDGAPRFTDGFIVKAIWIWHDEELNEHEYERLARDTDFVYNEISNRYF